MKNRSQYITQKLSEKKVLDTYVEVYKTIGSTNDRIWDLLSANAGEKKFIVISDQQVSGRGRRGHSWSSPVGGLYFSLAIPTKLSNQKLSLSNLVVALGVQKGVRDYLQSNLLIKWPNDLVYIQDDITKKVGGILLETKNNIESYVVAGIGINIKDSDQVTNHSSEEVFPGSLEQFSHQVELYEKRDDLVIEIIKNIFQIWEMWENSLCTHNKARLDLVLKKINESLCWQNQDVTIIMHEQNNNSNSASLCGRLIGINYDAKAVVELSSSRRVLVDFSHASIRKL